MSGGIIALLAVATLAIAAFAILIAHAIINAAEQIADEFSDADTFTAALASMVGEAAPGNLSERGVAGVRPSAADAQTGNVRTHSGGDV